MCHGGNDKNCVRLVNLFVLPRPLLASTLIREVGGGANCHRAGVKSMELGQAEATCRAAPPKRSSSPLPRWRTRAPAGRCAMPHLGRREAAHRDGGAWHGNVERLIVLAHAPSTAALGGTPPRKRGSPGAA